VSDAAEASTGDRYTRHSTGVVDGVEGFRAGGGKLKLSRACPSCSSLTGQSQGTDDLDQIGVSVRTGL
jgi:hypothetical protein